MEIQPFSIRVPADVERIVPPTGHSVLALAFGDPTSGHAAELIHALRTRFPAIALAGCSTAGEISGDVIRDGTLSGALIEFESTTFATATARVDSSSESFLAGATLAGELYNSELKSMLVFSDGLNVNGSELVRGINSIVPPSVVVSGGLAGDGDRFGRTWVIVDGEPVSGFVTAVGLYGDAIRVGHGSRGGWDIFGPERIVTRSHQNVLFELDGRPALALYKEYLGELASGLPATALLFPLAIRDTDDPDKQIVRTVLAVNEDDQSLTFAGDIPEGSRGQLMRANFDRLIDSAGQAAGLATEHTSGPQLSIAISCVGRRLILGERCEEELEAVLDTLPAGSTQIGFYSYGEIAPFASGHCDLHNQTLTLTTLSEVAA